MTTIAAGTIALSSLLKEHSFEIPRYQRAYTWTNGHIQDLWNDLEYCVKNDTPQHYFGQIVGHIPEKNSKHSIVDGQQRTCTAIIFLSVIRNYISKMISDISNKGGVDGDALEEFYGIRHTIEEDLFGIENKTNLDKVKYTLGKKEDNAFLQQFIIIKNSDFIFQNKSEMNKKYKGDILSDSQQKIWKAYWFFAEQIDKCINYIPNIFEQFKIIKAYYTKFVEQFRVSFLETADLADAYEIFECLNARGAELDTADLLKNYLFRITTDNKLLDSVISKWEKMISNLMGKNASDFIRYYWNATQTFTTKRNLYRELTSVIKTTEDSVSLVDDLLSLSDLYMNLIDPKRNIDTYSSRYARKITAHIRALHAMGSTLYIPIVLSIQKVNFTTQIYNEKDIEKILNIIELLVFRNNVIIHATANTLERLFSTIALDIFKNNDSTNSIVNKLIKQIKDDDEFEPNFIKYTTRTEEVIRYIFRKLNAYNKPEYECTADNYEIQIEHIMPQKLSKEWDDLKTIHEEYLWRLGNMTLLSGISNEAISNKPFPDKCKEYKKSDYVTTKMITEYKHWDEKAITERQKKLAEMALAIWKIK